MSFLNLLPVVIVIRGPSFYLEVLAVATIVITLMLVEIKVNPLFKHSMITRLLVVGLLFKINDNYQQKE